MNKAILAIPVTDVNRLKLFFANYKAIRKHYSFFKSLDLAGIHTKDSCLVIDANVGVNMSAVTGDVTVAGTFDPEGVKFTATFETSPEFEKTILEIFDSYE